MNTAPTIDWTVPDHDLDSVYGDGATPTERRFPPIAGVLAVAVVASHALVTDLGWAWWQHLLAAALVFDLAGGVVAMSLNSAKRFHHAPRLAVPRRAAALTRNSALFTTLHVQPVLIALVFPGAAWWWGLSWYAVCLAGSLLVTRVPLYLARPVAMLLLTLTAALTPALDHPAGFAWVPVVLVAKLVLGAVREEPYRPSRTGR